VLQSGTSSATPTLTAPRAAPKEIAMPAVRIPAPLLAWLAGLLLFAGNASATDEPAAGADPRAEAEAAVMAAQRAAVTGPHDIALRDQAVLRMPAKFAYVPAEESRRLLQAMGNQPGPNLLGMIVPDGAGAESDEDADAVAEEEGGNWIVVMEYVDSGHIKADDAKEWDAEALLKSLRDGTEQGNEERRRRGLGELQVLRWIEPPQYSADTNRLVWSAATKDKSEPGDMPRGVNYNTYALGREGYVSLNLVTDYESIEKEKAVARQLLAALQFNEGRRYADFTESTDRVAEYGLAALVGGIAAKKLGLLAVIAAFAVKFAKVIGVAAIAALGIGAKIFGSRKKGDRAD
jgi:uncharacterized membrane-anchored protein